MESVFSEEEKRWRIINFKVLEKQIVDAVEFFRANNIEPILIKGWAISLKYPEKYARFFSDIDLAVAPEIYDKAIGLAENHYLTIDLHKGLRHLDTNDWKDLFARSITHKIEQTDIRVLCEEDHLRVLCVHWLTDGGEYKHKLQDIFYAVENRSENFDWKRCLDTVSSTRRLWIIYTIGLTHRYLGLNISDLPFEREADDIPKWLIKTLEKEWASNLRLLPIHTRLNDRREVLRQIFKRIPPNPIQATIESEGEFDEKTRVIYQIKSVLRRIVPSAKRILAVIAARKK